MDHSHVVKMDTQLVRGDLRERRFLSLTVRRSTGHHRDLSGRLDTHCRTLPTTRRHRLRWAERADLDVRRNTDTDQASFFTRLLLLGTQVSVTGDVLCFIQCRFVIATVVIETSRGVKRKLAWPRKVPATHFNRIHSETVRDEIERTLDDVCCLRTAGAAIRVGGHLVREAAGDVHLNRRNPVSAGK